MPKEMKRVLHVLAVNHEEAEWIAAAGYGYDSEGEAKAALSQPGGDPFYLNQLKVYAITVPGNDH